MDKEDILYNQTQNFGRTQFVRELVKKNEQIIQDDKKILVITREMTKKEVVQRMLLSMSGSFV